MSFDQSGGQVSDAPMNFARSMSLKNTPLHLFLESSTFTITISLAIFATSIMTFIEQQVRSEGDDESFWLVIEILFTLIFFIECVLKMADEKAIYFKSSW